MQIHIQLSKFKNLIFPSPPSKSLPIKSLSKMQLTKIGGDIYFYRNYNEGWAKRTNPIFQDMLARNLCNGNTEDMNHSCPKKILELGCGVAGNLRHFCATNKCTRAVCIEGSSYAQFVNTMSLPQEVEFLIGNLQDENVYRNVPVKSFDLIYQVWATIAISNFSFHINSLLPNIYKSIVPNGYFAREGVLGKNKLKNNDKSGYWNTKPCGNYMGGNQKKRNSDSKDNDDDDEMKIENIEFENNYFFVDHCLLLVSTGHFKLIEDIRYSNRWSMLTSLNGVPTINITNKSSYPMVWEQNQKMDSSIDRWKNIVSGDCLLQKITDVSVDDFREDLKKIVGNLPYS